MSPFQWSCNAYYETDAAHPHYKSRSLKTASIQKEVPESKTSASASKKRRKMFDIPGVMGQYEERY
jgi:hypothetical protein